VVLVDVQKLLIAQVKMVLKVLFLYIPLPMFWALFDQQVTNPMLVYRNTHRQMHGGLKESCPPPPQGSRWTLQATNMNGNFVSVGLAEL